MNEKDVLGSRPAAWNVQKMKSPPHGMSAGIAHFPALIPSNLLGIILVDLIHSISLGYQQVAIPSTLLGYLIQFIVT